MLLLARLALALYWCPVHGPFDLQALGFGQIVMRIILAVLVMAKPVEVMAQPLLPDLALYSCTIWQAGG